MISDSPIKAYTCNADAFIEEFASHTSEMDNKRFCFILGAGASKTSGISLGGELALDWLKELHKQEAPSDSTIEEWATAANLGIPNFRLDRAGDFYTRIFERRFEGRMDDGQFWLERKFGTALPSTGYYFLAQILGNSKHKVVITTNFDNLVADAVLQLTGNLPRIISDARIARFLSPQPRLPIIAKVHGDIGFATTINTTDGIAKLEKEWKDPLRRILELYVPLVIGWEGNDGSLIDFFKNEMVDDQGQSLLPAGIFWCYRGSKSWQDRLAANSRLADLARVHTIRFIKTDGFDEWILRLARSLTKENPLETLRDQQKRRLEKFEENLREELKQSKKVSEPHTRSTSIQGADLASISLMLRIHDAQQEKNKDSRLEKLRHLAESHPESAVIHGILAVELHQSHDLLDEAEDHYHIGIKADPNDAEILGNYALFLETRRKDDEQAEELYLDALVADPYHSHNLGNYASFLETQRKDDDRAEEFYLKAIAADPDDASSLGRYAVFLETRRKDDERAEEFYLKALTAEPEHALTLGNYASFIETQRKDDERAEKFYLMALAAEPDEAINLGRYASFLETQRKDDERAEEFYLKALAAEPKNATNLGRYAVFLQTRRKDRKKAEEYYLKALDADSGSSSTLGNFASFLSNGRKDDSRAQEFYLKAIAANPDHAGNLGNYATFLTSRLKDHVKAEELFIKALTAEPDHAANLGNYAIFIETQGNDYERAEEYYLKALAAEPNNASNLGRYANFLFRAKDNDRAEAFFVKALAADPDDATNIGSYASFLSLRRNDYEQAEILYLRALAADPNEADCLGNYATFLASVLKDDARAEETYIKALEADPDNAANLGNYAAFLSSHEKTGQDVEDYFKKALVIAPTIPSIIANYTEFLVLHRTLDKLRQYIGSLAGATFLRIERDSSEIAAILWIAAAAANKLGRSNEKILASFKSVISQDNYRSDFSFGDLAKWAQSNFKEEEASFWIATAKGAAQTETLTSLDGFPEWGKIEPATSIESLACLTVFAN